MILIFAKTYRISTKNTTRKNKSRPTKQGRLLLKKSDKNWGLLDSLTDLDFVDDLYLISRTKRDMQENIGFWYASICGWKVHLEWIYHTGCPIRAKSRLEMTSVIVDTGTNSCFLFITVKFHTTVFWTFVCENIVGHPGHLSITIAVNIRH